MCETALRNAQQSCWMQCGWNVTYKVCDVDALATYPLCCFKANTFRR